MRQRRLGATAGSQPWPAECWGAREAAVLVALRCRLRVGDRHATVLRLQRRDDQATARPPGRLHQQPQVRLGVHTRATA